MTDPRGQSPPLSAGHFPNLLERLRNARAAYSVHIATVAASVLGSLAILFIAFTLGVQYRRRHRKPSLPTVLVRSPSSPHIWISPPGGAVDPTQLAPAVWRGGLEPAM
ncbi:hypothetical protein CspeluHIS016_0210050 [Cutaneotrichosporon spelunceum]|uniref:Uncharacterized protein n=1 Tax=Cutaneotrichosporon spelunceum TaxID=1672016 RepID=A0AAD3TSE1_9TREE|nr:hypothetical protein CspeluHIS016_0210050 [Cutaneotrichosporon spelunceum]